MPDSFENLLGPNNISTLIAANNLADIYCSEGEMLVARHLYGRALTGYKKVLGPDHKSALMIADNLANLSRLRRNCPARRQFPPQVKQSVAKRKRGLSVAGAVFAFSRLGKGFLWQTRYTWMVDMLQKWVSMIKRHLSKRVSPS